MKKLKYCVIILLMVFVPLIPFYTTNAASKELYVSTGGSDSNDGSAAKPLKTIQKALDKASAGTTIYVASGVYNQKISFKTSGSKTNPVILKAAPTAKTKPVLSGAALSGSAADGGLVTIYNVNYVQLDGFVIRDLSTTSKSYVPMGIEVTGACTGITIQNCEVCGIANNNSTTKANAHGIAVYGNAANPITDLVIQNNTVHNCVLGQSESVVLNGNVTNFKVNNNEVYDNNNIGIDFIGYEGVADGENDRVRNGECKYNYVHDITSAENPGYEGGRSADGIYVDGGYKIVIYGNIVENCDIGIETASEHANKATDSITVSNNLVMNCSSYAGICFGGSDSSTNGTATNIKIENNTVYNNNCGIVIQNANSATNVVRKNVIYQGNSGQSFYGTIGSNVIKDNIIYQKSGSISSALKNTNTIANASLVSGSGTNIKVASAYSGYGYQETAGTTAGTTTATTNAPTTSTTPAVPSSTAVKNYTIDGNDTEWKNIASGISSDRISSIKTDYDSNYVYICVNTTAKYPNCQLFINSDKNKDTGYVVSQNSTSGYEYMLENNKLYQSCLNSSAWTGQWKKITNADITMKNNNTVYEFKLSRKDLAIKDTFGFAFQLLNSSFNAEGNCVQTVLYLD